MNLPVRSWLVLDCQASIQSRTRLIRLSGGLRTQLRKILAGRVNLFGTCPIQLRGGLQTQLREVHLGFAGSTGRATGFDPQDEDSA